MGAEREEEREDATDGSEILSKRSTQENETTVAATGSSGSQEDAGRNVVDRDGMFRH